MCLHPFQSNSNTRHFTNLKHWPLQHSWQPDPQRCSPALTTPPPQTHRDVQSHTLIPPSPEVQRLAVTEFLQCSPALTLPSHSLQWRFGKLSSRHLNPHKEPLGNSACLMSRTCHLKVGRWPKISHRQKNLSLVKAFDVSQQAWLLCAGVLKEKWEGRTQKISLQPVLGVCRVNLFSCCWSQFILM